ncbi:DUF1292 domain-containing protein [Alkalicoccus luteus]|uniref:UPF0473 protein HCN83_02965 n=1 Tax=Alkalicoccus luteus TaxID=1237094 RepID=A0A969TVN7_9BACI|nr:DUF1292 domain-containing protein [Alkalicoccus luteus]NJP36549.1 DUF1292 domain-containing protein [Alkalicoccus luteus]
MADSDLKIRKPAEDDNRIIIPDQETGDEHLFEKVLEFDNPQTGHSYVLIAPEGTGESDEDEVEVHAFRYEDTGGEDLSLFPIETEEEWDMVQEVFNTIQDLDEEQ